MMTDFIFFLSEAITGMRRSGLMILISIATITVSLIVLGMFLLMSANIANLGDFMASKLEIRLYLKQSASEGAESDLRARIAKMKEVKSVKLVTRDDAWKKFQTNYPNMPLADWVRSNPLPDTIYVKLVDQKDIESMAAYFRRMDSLIDDVVYGGVIAQQIQTVSKFLRYSGFVLVGLLTLATLLIVMNTIRLTVIARQHEIEIMQLVGATNQFVRWPFLIEGLIIGSLGAGISIIILKLFYVYFVQWFQDTIPYFPLMYDVNTLRTIYLMLAGMGVFLGVVGAFIAVSRSLKTTF